MGLRRHRQREGVESDRNDSVPVLVVQVYEFGSEEVR